MTKEEQIQFVRRFLGGIADAIITDIELGKVPEEWNGVELKWLADYWVSHSAAMYKDKARKAKFNNTVLVNDL